MLVNRCPLRLICERAKICHMGCKSLGKLFVA